MPAKILKADAIEKLQRQCDQISSLVGISSSSSSEFSKWRRDTEVAIKRIFGDESDHARQFSDISYVPIMFWSNSPDSVFQNAHRAGLKTAESMLRSMIDEIKEYWSDDPTSEESHEQSVLSWVDLLCARFHLVARQIRLRHDGRQTLDVEDEYDVQDLFHALLVIWCDDVRKEEWTPSYAGGAGRMDFLLKREQVVVEIKKVRKSMTSKSLGDELLVDIQRYQAHPDCKTLVCFVYDPEGRLPNPRGIESDLFRSDGDPRVFVKIAPSGL